MDFSRRATLRGSSTARDDELDRGASPGSPASAGDLQAQRQRAATRAASRATGCSTPTTASPGHAVGGDGELAAGLVGVHDLQPVDVLDHAGRRLARERAAVADHVDLERHAQPRARPPTPPTIASEQRACRSARAAATRASTSSRRRSRCASAFSRRVADQAARIAHLVHHLVAAVDARGAADAFVLQAVADVDAGRAHLHADAAVDAVAEARGLRGRPCGCARRAARRAPRS